MAFFEDIIDESLLTQVITPRRFDEFVAHGWRLLGLSWVRHNFSMCRGTMCRTIPVRIALQGFEFSKSQRRLLRRNLPQLRIERGPIYLTPEKEQLFNLHAERFREGRSPYLAAFLHNQSHYEPVQGTEFALYDSRDALVACSFMHIGHEAISATYCFFNPTYAHLSLGAYTMLLEIEHSMALGKKYYYSGYCYSVPSQFDYKLNFNNLEQYDWKSDAWSPASRKPVRQWEQEVLDFTL